MRDVLTQSKVRYTHIRFFNRENKRWASAQLNILAEDEEIITRENFWPGGIFIKPWLPWEVFRNSKLEQEIY